jgi:hypothetical protein
MEYVKMILLLGAVVIPALFLYIMLTEWEKMRQRRRDNTQAMMDDLKKSMQDAGLWK